LKGRAMIKPDEEKKRKRNQTQRIWVSLAVK
jgi:hypothetical protein